MADKEEIRSRNDIVEVVQTFVPLKRRGRSYVGLCPFHGEKTPSFNVDPQTQTFKCYGCGEGGDVFKFVQRYENMGFVESAEFLARRAGLTFDRGPADAARASEREQLFDANRVAADWFQKCLDRAPDARAYLQGRGIAHETIRRFQIGFAPEDWEGLTGYLRSQRRDLRVAATAGLVKRREDNSYFDMFRGRIIFPILDEQERVVGFGGRAMSTEEPKYLNTGETPLFNKSKILYGLPYARRKIAAEGMALLMEGYMDVIAAHQAGFTNAIAGMGTSLTEDNAKKLARLGSDGPPVVALVYDADKAGIKATLKNSEILEKEGSQVRVVRLPAGEDPDSILKSGGVDRFQRAIDEAVGRVEYMLERIVANADQSTDAGKARMLLQIVATLASVPTRSERDVYVERVWRYHPSSVSGAAAAKMQLHQDAETYAATKGRPTRSPSPATSVEKPTDAANQETLRREERFRRTFRGPDGTLINQGTTRWKDRPRPIEPPPQSSGNLTSEERAERELMRALAEPEWRPTVLKLIGEEEHFSDEFRRLVAFTRQYAASLNGDSGALARFLMKETDESFSSIILERLQESHALLANVPVTEPALKECAIALRRHRIKALQTELERILQTKDLLTREDADRVKELHRIIRELKSSGGS